MLFDADHHITFASACGAEWPVSLRHGCVFLTRKDVAGNWTWQLACDFEYLAAMGFHIYPEVAATWGITPMQDILQQLPPRALRQLLGNGMHLTTQSSWMFYVLAHTAPKALPRQHMFRRSSWSFLGESIE